MGASERRNNDRVPARIRIIYVHDGDFLTSHSRDLSVDGMFVFTRKPPAVGETAELSFSLGPVEDLTVAARVVWVNRSEAEEDAGMGVQFIDPPPACTHALLETIRKIAYLGTTAA
jgi:uncharacterized protein (TIGR02266 family)